jgi:hypothetical protein
VHVGAPSVVPGLASSICTEKRGYVDFVFATVCHPRVKYICAPCCTSWWKENTLILCLLANENNASSSGSHTVEMWPAQHMVG